MRVISKFHTNSRIAKGENFSFLVLILKKRNMSRITDYRPISLVGCIYKVISKVLAITPF